MKEKQQKQVSTRYLLLVITALSMTFAASSVAVGMIYEDIIELQSDDNLENSTNDKDPIIRLIEHLIFLMIFLGFLPSSNTLVRIDNLYSISSFVAFTKLTLSELFIPEFYHLAHKDVFEICNFYS